MYKKSPKHDFTSHDADCFRYVAVVYEHLIKTPAVETPKKTTEERLQEELDNFIFSLDEPEEEMNFSAY